MLLTIIVFIIILGLLIFVHELGHFLAAKRAGVKVEEFAFGFPPRIWSIKRKGTVYAINLIPLGGYVKLLGEEEDIKGEKASHDKGSFVEKPVITRIWIVVAGVLMNFILAIVLMTIGFSIGMTPLVGDPATMKGEKISKVMVAYVVPGSPAATAGIEANNILNGFASTSDLQNYTRSHVGQEVEISVSKNKQIQNLKVKLSEDTNAPLGVSIVPLTIVKQSVPQAFVTSITETGKAIGALFGFLGSIIKNVFTTGNVGEAGANVVGPVGLFNFTAQAIKIGWIYVLQLVILLSINLGIINIMPFPALDGGKVLFLALEGLFRKKVIRAEIENIIHLVGFILLILLLVATTFKDIRNLF